MAPDPTDPGRSTEAEPRRRPSRRWYVVALLIVLVTGGLFLAAVMRERGRAWGAIESMPRFVGPTTDGHIVELDRPGDYVVYYENAGELDGRRFETPRQQVWTTPTRPSMSLAVVRERDQREMPVRLLGQTDAAPEQAAEFDQDRDVGVIYDRAGRQGAGVWTFTIDEPGRYAVAAVYLEAVHLDPAEVEVPPELTRDQQSQMRFADVERYEQDRAEAVARLALASLEPEDVLLAVGPDPTAGSYFNVAGLKGAATLLAFGLTAGTVIALVTLMLRTGSVTERGKMEDVKRGIGRQGDH